MVLAGVTPLPSPAERFGRSHSLEDRPMNAYVRPISVLPHVDATLNYLAPMADRPRNYASEPPAGVPRSNTVPETHTMPIHDVRPIAAAISLDREGFAVLRHDVHFQCILDGTAIDQDDPRHPMEIFLAIEHRHPGSERIPG